MKGQRVLFGTEQCKEDSSVGWHLGRALEETRVSLGEAQWDLQREDLSQALCCQLCDPGQDDNFCEPCFQGLK